MTAVVVDGARCSSENPRFTQDPCAISRLLYHSSALNTTLYSI